MLMLEKVKERRTFVSGSIQAKIAAIVLRVPKT
jgi:hypothetical protein